MTARFRTVWTQSEIDYLIKNYPNMPSEQIADNLSKKLSSVYKKASSMDLKKSEAFNKSNYSGRLNGSIGEKYRFQKGEIPWNKGKSCQPTGRAIQTQFKKGHKPHNHKPVGSIRIDSDGYVCQKIAESNKWRPQHTLNWEAVHGAVPKGHCLFFKDGNKLNTDISNLELISLAENMRRNTYHQYPKEIALAIQMRGALNRRINREQK